MIVVEAMVRLRTCVKNRESGRPRSLAVGISQWLFIENESRGA
jgi:hypothetical protein